MSREGTRAQALIINLHIAVYFVGDHTFEMVSNNPDGG